MRNSNQNLEVFRERLATPPCGRLAGSGFSGKRIWRGRRRNRLIGSSWFFKSSLDFTILAL